MKKTLSAFSLLSLFVFAVSCTPNGTPGKPKISQEKTVKMTTPFDPGTVDPRKVRDLSQVAVSRALFSGLTRLSRDNTAVNDLMDNFVRSQDGLEYFITIRPDIAWSNGERLTAHDVEASWKSSLNPEEGCPNASLLFVLKNGQKYYKGEAQEKDIGVHALNDHQLKIELESPCFFFEQLLATYPFFILPKSWIETDSHTRSLIPPSYGPFLIQDWDVNNKIVFQKNPEYHLSQAISYDTLEFHVLSDQTSMAMFEQQEIDWAGSPLSTIPLDAIPSLEQSGNLKKAPAAASSFLRVNTKKPHLQNAVIRRVLSQGINREELSEHVLHKSGVEAFQLAPPSMIYRSLQEDFIEKAKEDAAIFSMSEFPSQISLTFASSDRNNRIVQAVQNSLQKRYPSLQIILDPCEPKHLYTKIRQGDYDLALGSWVCDFYDADSFYAIFESALSGTNNTGWESSEFTNWLYTSRKEADPKKRTEAFYHMEKILMIESPIIPLFHNRYCYLQSTNANNIHVSPMGTFDYVLEQ